MPINVKQLYSALQKPLAPLYLISGDTPLLIQEAQDAVKNAAKKAGFTTCERLTIEPGFDWAQFDNLTQNFSLFSDKTLIDIRNPNSKFDDTAKKTLLRYLDAPANDKLVIMTTGKLKPATHKTKWFKALEQSAVAVTVWPVNARDLPQWIHERLQHAHLKADRESIALLAHLTEGNLLATHQAIEKLKLLSPHDTITRDKMLNAATNNARFTVFDLANYALQGHASKILHALSNLRFEGVEPTLVLWALTREMRTLVSMAHQLQQGQPMVQVIQKEWASRKPLVKMALQRLTFNTLTHLLQTASHCDRLIKGSQPGDTWDALTALSLALAGTNLPTQRSAHVG